jgi:hypothetical protein
MVKHDPSLSARYARHFGSTNYGVSEYFGKRLTLIRLRKPATTYVYYYNSSGNVARGRRVMPAGTLVFATESGEPVLDWRCGNPLRPNLPVRQAIRRTDKSPSMAKAGSVTEAKGTATGHPVKVATAPPDADRVIEKVLAATPAEFAPVATITPTSLEAVAAAAAGPLTTSPMIPAAAGAALPPIAEVAAIPTVSAVGAVPAILGASHAFSWLFPAMAALGGGVAIASKGNTTHQVTPPPVVPATPEPSAVLPLAASLATACTAILRKRRSFLRD